ncbi:diacylglycerol kinase family protein [Miniimonas sp. S16]|uniref:diacylglycerol/lipid kinase family protein n=1 Tax=Miniimonas sp. S16 TaxID=2171623 RepID=UPI000D529E8C|nr:diacylglycerol kinase family protein [Miniimonas sp. S16]
MVHAALVLGIIAVVLASVALWIAAVTYREHRTTATLPPMRAPRRVPVPRATTDDDGTPRPVGPAAFVINPIKVSDVEALETAARTISRELGLPDPLIFHTTVADPGVGQAKDALAAGASVVVAAGGDGTVRSVATALAGGEVPMALIPSGTGNLLARNLDLPVDGHSPLVRTALSGREVEMDLGWLTAIPAEGDAGDQGYPEHLFLVMAGAGFDAQMVAGADDALKRRIGWVAYFFAGVRHLHARRTRLALQVGNGAWQALRVRTLLFANCGRLPAGIVLLPDADLDDGYLDVAAIDTRGGLIGWASLLWRVLLQGIGVRHTVLYNPSSIEFFRGRSISVQLDKPGPVQVDGDLVGEAVEVHVRVQAGGLRVRVRR